MCLLIPLVEEVIRSKLLYHYKFRKSIAIEWIKSETKINEETPIPCFVDSRKRKFLSILSSVSCSTTYSQFELEATRQKKLQQS